MVLDFIDSDIVRFFVDNIGILAQILIILTLMILKQLFMSDLWLCVVSRFKQHRAFKKELSKELMLVAWHPKRL